MGPLEGIKVVEAGQLLAGPFAGTLMADQGADVIKVEAPGAGDGMRSMVAPGSFNAPHVALNRGKRSLSLDLKAPAAPAVLR